VVGLALLIAVTSWPQVIIARALAWMGRGLRQPIRSAMLAGSVGKATWERHSAFTRRSTPPARCSVRPSRSSCWPPATVFASVFAVALIPGVVAVTLFGILTRDPRRGRGEPVSLRVPLPGSFWRLIATRPTAPPGG